MINEFDSNPTAMHKMAKTIMSELSITHLIKAVSYMKAIQNHTDVTVDIEDTMMTFQDIIDKMKTDSLCSHCGGPLYLSDLPQYDFVCPECDENF